MRSVFFIPVVLFFILLSAFSVKKNNKSFYFPSAVKKVGVFDRDSLLDALPEYHHALDSVEVYKKRLETMSDSMKNQLDLLKKEYKTYESAYTPFVREYKQKQIVETGERIAEFDKAAKEDTENKKQSLVHPLNQNVTFAANDLAQKKKLDAILDKNDSIGYLKLFPTAKIINVTKQIHVKVGDQYLYPSSSTPQMPPNH